MPNLPQKDYFCFEDANKGNCFCKERARKRTLDPSFGFPPVLNLLELKSNPKYIIKCTVVQAARPLWAVLSHVSVPPAPSSAFEQKLQRKNQAPPPSPQPARTMKHLAQGCRWQREVMSHPAAWHGLYQSAACRGEKSQMVSSRPGSRLHVQVAPCHSLPSLKGGFFFFLPFLLSGFVFVFSLFSLTQIYSLLKSSTCCWTTWRVLCCGINLKR